MRSPINWALLGIVIERPSHAYDLARRFERTYSGVLSVSSTSHVYAALDALAGRALVEELPGAADTRQPKPRYRVTTEGLRLYERWLIEQVADDRRRQRVLVLQLAVLKGRADAARILDRYERAWLADPQQDADGAREEDEEACVSRLLREENRLTSAAKLAWIERVRAELETYRGPP